MSYNDSDELSYNPFAKQDDYSYSGGSNLATQSHYSSAYIPKVPHSPPSLRLRRSTSNDPNSSKVAGQHGKRSRTRIGMQVDIPYSTSVGLHPLKSALAKIDSCSAEDLGNTRPFLSRHVNEGTTRDNSPSRDMMKSESATPPDEEKDVIIHQISQKDSLPGVALKYGISMANLRRANQLWTSDSIHRREVLYIPVDEASRAREYISEPPLISLTPDEAASPPTTSSRATSASPFERGNAELNLRSPSAPVRRIPVKQLSYFPPSLHRSLSSPAAGDIPTTPPSSIRGSKGISSRYNTSPANNSLTSILTALPIAASTRDDLITRLSFDSTSSSFSDRSRTSRVTSDEENGHELNEVNRRAVGNDEAHDDYYSMPTPKAPQRISYTISSAKKTSNTTSNHQQTTPQQRVQSSMPPHQFYVSQTNETHIRTSQLEPSPAMTLPTLSSRTVGRSSGKRLQESTTPWERTSTMTLGRKSKVPVDNESGLTLETLKIEPPP